MHEKNKKLIIPRGNDDDEEEGGLKSWLIMLYK